MARLEPITIDVNFRMFGLTIDELYEAVQHYRRCTNSWPGERRGPLGYLSDEDARSMAAGGR